MVFLFFSLRFLFCFKDKGECVPVLVMIKDTSRKDDQGKFMD